MNCWNCCNVWVSRSNFCGNYPERNVGKALLQRLGVNVKSSMAVWLRLNFEFKFLTLGSSCPGYDFFCCKDSLPEMFLPQPQVRTHGFLEQRWAACGTDQLAWRSSSCSSTSDSDCHLVKAALYRWLIIDLDDCSCSVWSIIQPISHSLGHSASSSWAAYRSCWFDLSSSCNCRARVALPGTSTSELMWNAQSLQKA